jgi:restriction system protein
MTVWLVRAGSHGDQESIALDQGIACVGWDEIGDLAPHQTVDEIAVVLRVAKPQDPEASIMNQSRQLHAFAHRIKKGDLIVLPLKSRSQIAFGRAEGPYKYRPELGSGAMHTRSVRWLRTDVPRTSVGQDLLYSLGAFLTVCQIQRNNAEARLEAVAAGIKDPGSEKPVDPDPQPDVESHPDIEQLAQDQLLKHVMEKFKGHRMARLVEAVLQSEGYTTKLSPPGPDGGVDILAGRGALGLEGPRLCVQVKSSESPADVTTLRTLQGSMSTFKSEQGLLVAWGGLNGPAEKESRHSYFAVRVWDSAALLDAVFRNYDTLASDVKAELPLKRIWALVPETAE